MGSCSRSSSTVSGSPACRRGEPVLLKGSAPVGVWYTSSGGCRCWRRRTSSAWTRSIRRPRPSSRKKKRDAVSCAATRIARHQGRLRRARELEKRMTRLVRGVVALATLALGADSAALAHEGHDHKVMGTVTMAAVDHVMLKDKDGKDVIVKVTKDTKVKATPAIKVEEIKAGTRVVVTAVEDKDKGM